MKFDLTAEFYLIDSDGTSRKVACKGNDLFVQNFLIMWSYSFTGISISALQTNNTNVSISVQSSWPVNAPAGNANYGPMVGTGTTAPQVTNYNLQTKIAHGSGSGQLLYGATSLTAATTSGSTRFWKASRTFTNSSGSSITVNEVGLVLAYQSTYYIMIARDVLSSGVVINNGQVGTLVYTFAITV